MVKHAEINVMYNKRYALCTLYWRFRWMSSARHSTWNNDVPMNKENPWHGYNRIHQTNPQRLLCHRMPSELQTLKSMQTLFFRSLIRLEWVEILPIPPHPAPSLFSLPHSLAHPPIDAPPLIRPVVLLGKTKRNHNRVYSRLSCISISSLGKLRLSEGFSLLR